MLIPSLVQISYLDEESKWDAHACTHYGKPVRDWGYHSGVAQGVFRGVTIPTFRRTHQPVKMKSVRSIETLENTTSHPRRCESFKTWFPFWKKSRLKAGRSSEELSWDRWRHTPHVLRKALRIRTAAKQNICDLPTTSSMEISFCRTVGNSTSLNHRHDTTWALKVMRARENASCLTDSTRTAATGRGRIMWTEMDGFFGRHQCWEADSRWAAEHAENRTAELPPQPHDSSQRRV